MQEYMWPAGCYVLLQPWRVQEWHRRQHTKVSIRWLMSLTSMRMFMMYGSGYYVLSIQMLAVAPFSDVRRWILRVIDPNFGCSSYFWCMSPDITCYGSKWLLKLFFLMYAAGYYVLWIQMLAVALFSDVCRWILRVMDTNVGCSSFFWCI
jgi:hypothetical protein